MTMDEFYVNPRPTLAHLRKVCKSLIKIFGEVHPRERIAEEHRREHESIQEGKED